MKQFKFIAILACTLLAPCAQAGFLYTVTLETVPLTAHPAAPFSLQFHFLDGDGTAPANNTVSLFGFDFGGGAPMGTPTTIGSAFGDLFFDFVDVSDAPGINLFSQEFTPGFQLTFSLFLTGNANPGPVPDRFAFSILDGSGFELPTAGFNDIGADVFLYIDSDGTYATYSSDPFLPPFGGGDPVLLSPPRVDITVINDVPEPGQGLLLAAGLGLLAMIHKVRRR